MKTSFKNYLSEQKQETLNRLLQVVSMDTARSRELAIHFLHKGQPVPELLIKTVSESPSQSTLLARAYVMNRLDPPRELIVSVSDDDELSLALAGAYMESYHHLNPFEKIPDTIMNSVASHTPIAYKFATSLAYYYSQSLMNWKTNPFPPIIIRSLKRNDEYLKKFRDYVQTLQNPFAKKYLLGLLQTEENEEKEQQFNKEKYLPKLLEIIAADRNQLLITVKDYLNKGMYPPQILLKKMVEQNEKGSDSEYGNKLIQIFGRMVDEKMQIPDYLHQHMVMRYPFVVWRNYMSNDLPVPKQAEEMIYKNSFLVAALAREFLDRNKPVPERALQVLSKNPREIYYILETQIKNWWEQLSRRDEDEKNQPVDPIFLPQPLVKALLKDKKILESSLNMLRNQKVPEKYWPFRKKKEGKK